MLLPQVQSAVERINTTFGGDDYQPVVLIQRPLPLNERTAYYSVAECCVVTAIRDGLNLIPYEYTICRDAASPNTASQSMLIISEFIGCSPSLSGAIRVNPWNINNVMEAMLSALTMPGSEKEMRHEKHFRYVSTHDVVFWARSFMADLERVCKDHAQQRCWGIGFGFGFRIVALDPMFRKLRAEDITSAYKRTTNRIILLDYDGTMVPLNAIDKTPGPHIISVLNNLCDDPNNLVFIVSGRSRDVLQGWFSPCRKLGLSAEHGYSNRYIILTRWKNERESLYM
jgi:trehalose 6-phosphate synthase/phosphatase